MALRQVGGVNTVFVDLFGGSGLISHTIKQTRPDCRVVYNDYDNYSERLSNVSRTNAMLRVLRPMVAKVPDKARIMSPLREDIINEIDKFRRSGYVDWISLSYNFLFAMTYVTNFEDFAKASLFNCVRKSDYDVEGYLSGVEIVSMDYRELFEIYRCVPNVVFILDPPYLSTDCSSYKNYWHLTDYLDVLKCLDSTKFVYFTSVKSDVMELTEWMSNNQFRTNPFKDAKEYRIHVCGEILNYDDIMLDRTS